jgi:transcriptional regulator with XRE-family HTH domain
MNVTDKQALHRIAVNLRRLRESKGLSMNALARAIDDYPATISRVEDEQHTPGIGVITRIADALGVTVNDLLEEPSRQKLSAVS